jgi:hypothetical protein
MQTFVFLNSFFDYRYEPKRQEYDKMRHAATIPYA